MFRSSWRPLSHKAHESISESISRYQRLRFYNFQDDFEHINMPQLLQIVVNHRSFSSTRVNFEFVALQSTFPKLGFVSDSFTDFKILEQLGSILPKKELSIP